MSAMQSSPRPRRWSRLLAWFVGANVLALVAGILAGGWHFASQIEADALRYEQVQAPVMSAQWQRTAYDSPLGEMAAWEWPASGTTWLVLVHGRTGSPEEMTQIASVGHELGMPALTIAYRGDPGQPADPSGYYGFGETEWADVAAALEYARERGARSVVLGGISMGGGIVAGYLRRQPHDGFLKAIVLDAPMLDFSDTIDLGASKVALPWGSGVPAPLSWTAKTLASARFGVDWDAMDYNDDTGWVSVPTVVLHGDADATVPVQSSRDLAERDPDVTYVEVPDVDHVVSTGPAPRSLWEPAVRRLLKAAAD